MALNTVIFDFDGTIADTNSLIINSWQHTYMERTGKPGNEEDIIRSFGEPLAITMKKVFPQFDVNESIEIYRSYQVGQFEKQIRPFPGMVETVRNLKTGGYKVAVVTSRLRNTTLHGLNCFGIANDFDVIVSCEDTDKHKPNPEPVLMALDRLSAKPEEAVMVGDSMFDICCAHNAGVQAALVGWALAVTEQDMQGKDRPEYVLKAAKDIFGVLKEGR